MVTMAEPLSGRRVATLVLAMGLAYAVCALAWINRLAWVVTGQGRYYWPYYGCVSLAVFATLFFGRAQAPKNETIARTVRHGLISGYLGVLVTALIFAAPALVNARPSFQGSAPPRVAELLSELLAVGLAALLAGGWVFGALSALFFEALERRRMSLVAIPLVAALAVCLGTEVLGREDAGRPFAHVQFSNRPAGF